MCSHGQFKTLKDEIRFLQKSGEISSLQPVKGGIDLQTKGGTTIELRCNCVRYVQRIGSRAKIETAYFPSFQMKPYLEKFIN